MRAETEFLQKYVENILARTNAYVVFYDPFYHPETSPTPDDHKDILSALRAHDKEKCVALMKAHLRKQSPDWIRSSPKSNCSESLFFTSCVCLRKEVGAFACFLWPRQNPPRNSDDDV